MIGALRPMGALLAALAAWSLALLALAVAGLGARVGPHPPNAALAPPLPQVSLTQTGSRLGPLSNYMEVGSRPLLSADRRPAPVTDAGDGNSEAPLEVILTSVLIAGDVKLAIVQNQGDPQSQRVRLGETVAGTGWRLVELQPRRAVFEGPQGRRELELRVFDGQGGATVVSGSPQPPPAAAPSAPSAPKPAGGAATQGGTEAVAATPAPAEDSQPAAEMTQEQQVEAIRRRIEARRAQMRAENARRNSQQVE
jgi:general secretion pathway protein N